VIPTAATSQEAVNTAVRVLAQNGLIATEVDEAAGVVTTEWQATEFNYGAGPNGLDAYIVRRFTATVTPQGNGTQVHMTVDDMKCEDPGLFVAGKGAAHAGCVNVDGVVPPDQRMLDKIGAEMTRQLP